jgi:hypothetical protein
MRHNAQRSATMNMDYTQITKQVVDFQKMSLANVYNAVTIVQEQTASAVDTILEQNSWLPEQGREAMQSWINVCRQEQVRFKRFVDQSFSSMEQFLNQDKKPVSTKAKKQKA